MPGRIMQALASRQLQLTMQLSVGIVLSALFTLVQPLAFRHACLTPSECLCWQRHACSTCQSHTCLACLPWPPPSLPVFVILVIGSLAFDQHVGTRLQVCVRSVCVCGSCTRRRPVAVAQLAHPCTGVRVLPGAHVGVGAAGGHTGE